MFRPRPRRRVRPGWRVAEVGHLRRRTLPCDAPIIIRDNHVIGRRTEMPIVLHAGSDEQRPPKLAAELDGKVDLISTRASRAFSKVFNDP